MIRVVHVISDLSTGGAEVMLAKLVGRMDTERFANVVVSLTDKGDLGELLERNGTPLYTLGFLRGRPRWSGLTELIRLLKLLRPTLMQTWLYHADLLGSIASLVSGGPPVIWNVRCSDMDLRHYPLQTRMVVRLLALASRFPHAVVVNSQAGRAWHESLGFNPRRWRYIGNGFDLDEFRPNTAAKELLHSELGLPADNIVIAHVARVDPMKDHLTLLAAAKRVVARRPNARFLLIGQGTQDLKPLLEEHGLSDRAYLLGKRGDISKLLPGTDLVCLSSISEGFPNVLGEAMACGVPCVSTDVGDARLIIGETGLVIPPRDAEGLANAIVELIDRGPEVRRELGRAARRRIEAEYSLPCFIHRYQTLYAELSQSAS